MRGWKGWKDPGDVKPAVTGADSALPRPSEMPATTRA
jgi:hypothetical protein